MYIPSQQFVRVLLYRSDYTRMSVSENRIFEMFGTEYILFEPGARVRTAIPGNIYRECPDPKNESNLI